MIDKEVKRLMFVISILILFLGWAIYLAAQSRMEGNAKSHEAGRRAFAAGVPSTANPHIGTSHDNSAKWLEGWIEAKEQRAERP